MVVVLPAPLGPRNPKISPSLTWRSTSTMPRWLAVRLGQRLCGDDGIHAADSLSDSVGRSNQNSSSRPIDDTRASRRERRARARQRRSVRDQRPLDLIERCRPGAVAEEEPAGHVLGREQERQEHPGGALRIGRVDTVPSAIPCSRIRADASASALADGGAQLLPDERVRVGRSRSRGSRTSGRCGRTSTARSTRTSR